MGLCNSNLCGLSDGNYFNSKGISLTDQANPDEDAVGMMHKLGGGKHTAIWQERLFVLKGSEMRYYKSRADSAPRGVIRLVGACYYLVRHPNRENHFRIKHKDFKTRDLSCESKELLQLWGDAIQNAIKVSTEKGEHSGWIWKKDKSGKRSFKRRYAIVSGGIGGGHLRYYEEPDDLVEKGSIPLRGCLFEAKNGDGGHEEGLKYFSIRTALNDSSARQFYIEGGLGDLKNWEKAVTKMSGKEEGEGEKKAERKTGWLLKKGRGTASIFSRKNWKKRFFTFDCDSRNLTWSNGEQSAPLGCLKVDCRSAEGESEVGKYNHTFNVSGTVEGTGKVRVLKLRAEDYETMEDWINEMNDMKGKEIDTGEVV